MTERDRRALVVRGGWPGHAPEEAAELFVPFLEASGYDVTLEGSLESLARSSAHSSTVESVCPNALSLAKVASDIDSPRTQ